MSDEFRLTEDHLKLLRAAYVGWNGMESGAPTVDPKRPYGSSDLAGGVSAVLGWGAVDDDDDAARTRQEEAAWAIHAETETALQIVLCFAGSAAAPGLYRRRKPYDYRTWEFVS